MNAKHRKTLAVLLGGKTPKNLPFRDLESLFRGLGCDVEEGEGSRVTFSTAEHAWTTHRPHPGKSLSQ